MDFATGFVYPCITGSVALWEGDMFQIVTEENIEEVALIHLLSWQESYHNLIENLYVLPD